LLILGLLPLHLHQQQLQALLLQPQQLLHGAHPEHYQQKLPIGQQSTCVLLQLSQQQLVLCLHHTQLAQQAP
jgi:hypothetical protein